MKSLKTITAITLATALSYACGGGGGDGNSAGSPNGIYTGTITGGNTSFNGDGQRGIIQNGNFMSFSSVTNNTTQIFNANLSVSNSSLTGTGKRFAASSFRNDIDYSGSFVNGQSASIGFIKSDSNATPLPSGTINLNKSASLLSKGSDTNRLAGTWSGIYNSGFTLQMDLNFDSSGNITSGGDQSPDNCIFTGSVTTADTSVNIYNVSITSDGGTSCSMPANTYTGFAWTEGPNDGTLVLMFADDAAARAVILIKN